MKRLILAAVLITGLNPSMAQQMRGPLDTRTTDSERVNNPRPYESAPVRIKPIAEIQREADAAWLETDLAKPCTRDAPFGCRTGGR